MQPLSESGRYQNGRQAAECKENQDIISGSDKKADQHGAYQGGGRGVPMERIQTLENWVQGELRPDHTLLLDMPVADGLQRAGTRSEPDRFEQEKHAFFERVRETYLARAKAEPGRFHVIDASPALDVVQQHITNVLQKILGS